MRSGKAITFTYDALNRRLGKSPSGEAPISYGHDLAGHLTVAAPTSGSGTVFSYDTAGRLTGETNQAAGLSVSYGLDGVGNRTRLTWPDGYYVAYRFDAANRMAEADESGSTLLAKYTYDTLGRRTVVTYGNGTAANYGYSGAVGDLVTLGFSFSGDAIANTASYSPTLTYSYNAVHQRLGVVSSDPAYISLPSRSGASSNGVNAVNEITSLAGIGLSYDGNANLSYDGTNSYTYDTENHLISASGAGNNATYSYDSLGRRSAKTVNGLTTNFLYGGQQQIADYDANNNLLRRFVPGPGLDEPIVTINVSSGGVKSFNHQDGHGSVIALSGSNGWVTEKDAYDGWGQTSTPSGNPFRFAGMRIDAETGNYYDRARDYCPAIGRFCQPDPTGPDAWGSLYDYCYDDPVNCTDPYGFCSRCSREAPRGMSRVIMRITVSKIAPGLVTSRGRRPMGSAPVLPTRSMSVVLLAIQV